MKKFQRSPINYMGNKYRSLPYIVENFKEDIHNFYDVFGGSATVSLNTKARKYFYNEAVSPIKELLEFLSKNDPHETIKKVKYFDKEFDLCSEEGFKKVRELYNIDKDPNKLYSLINHSFNYLIRFNKKHEFNASPGKGICKLSQENIDKLINFKNFVDKNNVYFYNLDFRDFISKFEFSENDYLYFDPPYALSEANYNEKRGFVGWSSKDSDELLLILKELDDKNIKWGYSDMISSKGKTNDKLIDWINTNNFKIFSKEVSYNGVPSTRLQLEKSVEVFITNLK